MNSIVLASALLALSTYAAAQTAPCLAFNDQNASIGSAITATALSGPTTRAYQFTATCTQALRAARIFTGSPVRDWAISLEIWSHDPTTQLPLARLGGGTCKVRIARGDDWFGANFDHVLQLAANGTYWFVWIEPGSQKLPYEPGGATLLPNVRRSGASWVADVPHELKLRLYDALLDGTGATAQSDGCTSSAGLLGTAFTNDVPNLGNALFEIEGTGFAPGAPAVLFLGVIPSFGSIPISGTSGCSLHNELLIALNGATFTGTLRSVTPSGNLAYPFPIPNLSFLLGQYAGAFFLVLDAGSAQPLPIVTSNGLGLVVQ